MNNNTTENVIGFADEMNLFIENMGSKYEMRPVDLAVYFIAAFYSMCAAGTLSAGLTEEIVDKARRSYKKPSQ